MLGDSACGRLLAALEKELEEQGIKVVDVDNLPNHILRDTLEIVCRQFVEPVFAEIQADEAHLPARLRGKAQWKQEQYVKRRK